MKHLILVRHAKSSWKDSTLEDHERPLNKRGKREAPFMAKKFGEQKMKVDLIVSSTAERAMSTAKEFAKKLDYKAGKIVGDAELYLVEADELLAYVKKFDDDNKCVMLFGHNPGLTWFANYLTNGKIENVPTSGIVAIDFDVKSWNEIAEGTGIVRFFEYPKMYLKEDEE